MTSTVVVLWHKLNVFIIMQQLLNPSGNFNEYRSALDRSVDAAKLEKERRCVVPFFSLLIKDLYFLNERMTDL